MLVSRPGFLAAIEGRLAVGGGVVVRGPAGIGRSVVLDAVAAAATARGELVLCSRPTPAERLLPYAGIGELLRQVPSAFLTGLPVAQRTAVESVRRGGPVSAARRLSLATLLVTLARQAPLLLVLDDPHWLDTASADMIGSAVRRRLGARVRVLAAERRPDPDGGRRAVRLCPAPAVVLTVPPLPPDDLAEVLQARGLPYRVASRVHATSGGHPALAMALGAAWTVGPPWRIDPLPPAARSLLQRRLGAVSGAAAETLLFAALADNPTVTTLVRAGRADAERDLRAAAAAGLVSIECDTVVRFTPPALATVLAGATDADRRAAVHHALAVTAVDATVAVKHRALRSGRPDAAMARALVAAARSAADRGASRTAAELFLLAADRCPRQLFAVRLDWLLAAAQAALTAGSHDLAGRAAEAVLEAGAPPAHRVRARLVLLDLAGQALADMADTFAAALVDAGDDPALLAPVRLRLAWQAMVTGAVDAAGTHAARAITAARAAADAETESMALTVRAQAERIRGDERWRATLTAALALPAARVPALLHLSARYLAARCAMVEDRLDEARADLLGMLAVADRDRGGEGLVEVLRSLSEVAVRAGRCREALRYADRAVAVAANAGLSPGPGWYTAAMAELAGGSIAAAARHARRGLRASEQEGDSIYLQRNLHALGQAALRAGDTREGVAALCRLRDVQTALGATDPLIVRWHGDLAGGLAAMGEHAAATATLAAARTAAHRLGNTCGVSGYLDRATAVVYAECGRVDEAVLLAAAAARRFALLGQPLEQGHALLVQGGAERRRRRYAAARAAVGAAMALFLQADARPWAEQTERILARAERTSAPSAPGGAPPELGLTLTEARIAGLVRDGASNREIATALYLSVKTVEATLTRVYRKVGVRSRTQLSSRLVGVGAPPSDDPLLPVRA